jgi:hypothetical protein
MNRKNARIGLELRIPHFSCEIPLIQRGPKIMATYMFTADWRHLLPASPRHTCSPLAGLAAASQCNYQRCGRARFPMDASTAGGFCPPELAFRRMLQLLGVFALPPTARVFYPVGHRPKARGPFDRVVPPVGHGKIHTPPALLEAMASARRKSKQ